MSNSPPTDVLCYSPEGICSYYNVGEDGNCNSLGWPSESCYPVDSIRPTLPSDEDEGDSSPSDEDEGDSSPPDEDEGDEESVIFSQQLIQKFVWEFEQDPEPVVYRRYTDDSLPIYRLILKNLSENLTIDAYVLPTTPSVLQVIDVDANIQITNNVPIRLLPLENKTVRIQFITNGINLAGVQSPQLQFRLEGFIRIETLTGTLTCIPSGSQFTIEDSIAGKVCCSGRPRIQTVPSSISNPLGTYACN